MNKAVLFDPAQSHPERDEARRRHLVLGLMGALLVLAAAGLFAGSQGWSWPEAGEAGLIVGRIRAPRTLGAGLVGALLGLAGAVAQGLFRNPLADPYLLGTASGASLAVVGVLAAGSGLGAAGLGWLLQLGLVGAAFAGALAGVALTLAFARGAGQPLRLLLSGVVVGVVLAAASDLVTTAVPEALRGRQAFMLGSTALLGWDAVAWLGAGLALALPAAWRLARGLDALGLGEDSAASLGVDLKRLRWVLVVLIALCTGVAVAEAGLVAFVGLVAPHLVRRFAPAPQAFNLPASAAAGAVLLLGADLLARSVIAPAELPVGLFTALLGGLYLLWLLRRETP